MEEKNKLVAEMEVAKKGGSIATIVSIVKKYCPEIQIDSEFLAEFSKVLSGLNHDLYSDERAFDRASDLFPPDFDEQDRLRDSMTSTTKAIKEKAGSPEIIDVMSKVKHVLSVIVYKESQCSERETILDQQLIDIRESLRIDEFDPTDDERLDQDATESHPTYRTIKGELRKVEELEQMFGHDRTLLDTAIKMYEKEAALYHNSYDYSERYEYWPEYEKGIVQRLKQIDEMQKGGKK